MAIVHSSFHAFFPADRQFEQPIFDLFHRPKDPFERQPPEDLREVHDRVFFGRVWEQLLERIRNPVQEAFLDNGDRQVLVLGSALFHFGSDGVPVVFMWKYRAGEAEALLPAPPHRIAIGDTPHGDTWLEALRPGFAAELERRRVGRYLEPRRNLVETYSHWAFARYVEAIRRHCDLRVMRMRIAKALALDPFLLSVARRIRLDFGHADYATLREYAHVADHREAYGKLAVEAPHLMALFAALATLPNFPGDGEPLERLRLTLAGLGFSPRLWRLLVNAKRNPIRLVYRVYKGLVSGAVIDYLRILDGLRVRELPPEWLLWDMIQVQGDPKKPRLSWRDLLRDEMGPYRHVAMLFARATPAERQTMRPRLYPVLAWIIDRKITAFDGPRRKAGWKWLDASAAAAEEESEERLRRERMRWSVPFREDLVVGAFVARALDSAVALWEEGRAMHHCIDKYGPSCFEGKRAVFSIREAANGKRVATASLVFAGRWQHEATAGFANQPVSSRVGDVVRRIVRRANLEHAVGSTGESEVAVDEVSDALASDIAESVMYPAPGIHLQRRAAIGCGGTSRGKENGT